MKYIEELENGDSFVYNQTPFIITTDFDKKRCRLCVDLSSGMHRWFDPDTMVEHNPIFSLDKDSNIIPIKETKQI